MQLCAYWALLNFSKFEIKLDNGTLISYFYIDFPAVLAFCHSAYGKPRFTKISCHCKECNVISR